MCIWTAGTLSLVASGGRWPGGEKLVPSEAAGEETRHFVGACMAKEFSAVVVMCRHDSDSEPGHRESTTGTCWMRGVHALLWLQFIYLSSAKLPRTLTVSVVVLSGWLEHLENTS